MSKREITQLLVLFGIFGVGLYLIVGRMTDKKVGTASAAITKASGEVPREKVQDELLGDMLSDPLKYASASGTEGGLKYRFAASYDTL